MSFHFNLSGPSSSEEDDRYSLSKHEEEEEQQQEGIRLVEKLCDQEEWKELQLKKSVDHIQNDSDEDDILDWEDGQEEEEEELRNQSSRENGVAIAIISNDITTSSTGNSSATSKSTPTKKRSRVLHKLTNLPLETTQLMRNVHQTHLLALSARAVYSFQQIIILALKRQEQQCDHCSRSRLLLHAVATSLIPLRFFNNNNQEQKNHQQHSIIPTYDQVKDFTHWYFTWVGGAQQSVINIRRRNIAMGAPSYSFNNTSSSNYSYDDGCCRCISKKTKLLNQRLLLILHQLASSYHNDDPTSTTNINIAPQDKLNLYIFLCYACLHWKGIRYVNAFLPIELELTCSHPLFLADKANNIHNGNNNKYHNLSSSKNYRTTTKKTKKNDIIDLTAAVDEDQNSIMNTDSSAIASIIGKMWSSLETRTKKSSSSNPSATTSTTTSLFVNGDNDDVHYENTAVAVAEAAVVDGDRHVWVEVLCRASGANTHLKWIHVENEYEFFDQPHTVEHILTELVKQQQRQQQKNSENDLCTQGKATSTNANTNTSGEDLNSASATSGSTTPISSSRRTPRKNTTATNKNDSRREQQKQKQNHLLMQTKKSLITSSANSNNNSQKGKQLVSYVLAVEHRVLLSTIQRQQQHSSFKKNIIISGIHLTDVTPRYASVWSKTLRLRGATSREILATVTASRTANEVDSSSLCPPTSAILWWEDALKKVNQSFQNKPTNKVVKDSRTSSDLSDLKPFVKRKKKIICIDVPPEEEEEEKVTKGKSHFKIGAATNNKSSSVAVRSSDHNSDDAQQQLLLHEEEQREFKAAVFKEAIPTSKNAFKNHPVYAIPSVLKENEVIVPQAKSRICGMFKGELVYKRCDVSPVFSAKKWLYEGRQVRLNELNHPIKITSTTPQRRRNNKNNNTSKTFKALETYGFKNNNEAADEGAIVMYKTNYNEEGVNIQEGDEEQSKVQLYGKWQTVAWSPQPIGPHDAIPRNEYGNLEKALINPGLTHLEEPRMSLVAKKLGIPYTPCLVGFEGHHGNRTPTIRGIAVHQHNVMLLREAYAECESHYLEKQFEKQQQVIYLRWKRLIVGTQTKARLEREYGGTVRSSSSTTTTTT